MPLVEVCVCGGGTRPLVGCPLRKRVWALNTVYDHEMVDCQFSSDLNMCNRLWDRLDSTVQLSNNVLEFKDNLKE